MPTVVRVRSWLGDVVARALLERLNGVAEQAGPGDDDHGGVGRLGSDDVENGQAVHLRHAEVNQKKIRALATKHLDPFPAVRRLQDGVARVLEMTPDHPSNCGVIVYHE